MTEQHTPSSEQEFYAEPAQLTRRDTVGVVVALIALTVIGASGYVWLNPNLSLSSLMAGAQGASIASSKGPAPVPAPVVTAPDGRAEVPAAAGATDLIAAAVADRQAECPQCGMLAGASDCEVVAKFADGSLHHFDSWVCVYGWSKDNSQAVTDAVVMAHGSTPDAPHWLSAADSVFLYDTKRIAGSMPPYVAAFASQAEANVAQAQDGGQLVAWGELPAKFK